MTRREAEVEIKKKSKEGYVTHTLLLDLYEMDEEIPTYAEHLFWYKPTEPQDIVIYLGKEGMKQMDELFKKLI